MPNSKSKEKRIPKILPILSVTEIVLFPKMVFPITITNETDELIKVVKGKSVEERIIGLIQTKGEDFCEIGTVVLVVDVQTLPNKDIKLTLQGLRRFKVNSFIKDDSYLKGNIVLVKEVEEKTVETKALVPTAIKLFNQLVNFSPDIPREFGNMIQTIKLPSQVSDMIASSINISSEEKQKFLEIRNVKERLQKLIHLMAYQIEELKIGVNIATKAKKSMTASQKNYYLRQQLKAIKEELGDEEDDESLDEVEEYKDKIESNDLPKLAYKEANRELKRLKKLHPSAAERSVITTYLDWLTSMPWGKCSKDKLNIKQATKVLDSDHYGLEKPKKRVLEYLAVRKLKPDSQGPVLCFVGPPGCLDEDMVVLIRRGKRNSGRKYTIEEAYRKFNHIWEDTSGLGKGNGNVFWSKNIPTLTLSLKDGVIGYHEIESIIDSGIKTIYKITVNTGETLQCSAEHPFKVPDGTEGADKDSFKRLFDLKVGENVLTRCYRPKNKQERKIRKTIYGVQYHPYAWKNIVNGKNYKRIHYSRLVVEAYINNLPVNEFMLILKNSSSQSKIFTFLSPDEVVHHIDEDVSNDDLTNLLVLENEKEHRKLHRKNDTNNLKLMLTKKSMITSIVEVGKKHTYDIKMKEPYYNYIAQGFIVHNTGKTSLGRSIASALGREFIRISLGGVRDEAEIRGHRRTYVGALPGRIIQGIKRAGTSNPVFMLDEIDKLGRDFRGDPSSALLEVLDPEQNFSFSDHYLDVPFDLSKVMFITTANVLDTIPPALKDRMEVIKFSGYTEFEKINIAKQFLISKQRKAHGLQTKQISFTKKVLEKIINDYTYEAGVRNLERQIAGICRGVATDIVSEKIRIAKIKMSDIKRYLGREKMPAENKIRDLLVGMCPMLYVGGGGGGISFIEAAVFKGTTEEEIILTGQLGEVMQESAIIALNYIRTLNNDIKIPDFTKEVVHIHIPEGATFKDGPSAGISLFCALVSLLKDKPIKKDLTMSGEITLKGEVLPVGGVKEKVLAAHRVGMNTIILPKWNENDLDDVPDEIKEKVKFYFVSKALEVLELIFDPDVDC